MANVLVIEDTLGSTCYLLEVHGNEAVGVVNGKDGVVALTDNDFDLVICDMPMPVQEGIETIQQIRELDADIPIIAISGAHGDDNFSPLDDARALGADRTVKKPFTVAQLMAAIDDLLGRGQASTLFVRKQRYRMRRGT